MFKKIKTEFENPTRLYGHEAIVETAAIVVDVEIIGVVVFLIQIAFL